MRPTTPTAIDAASSQKLIWYNSAAEGSLVLNSLRLDREELIEKANRYGISLLGSITG